MADAWKVSQSVDRYEDDPDTDDRVKAPDANDKAPAPVWQQAVDEMFRQYEQRVGGPESVSEVAQLFEQSEVQGNDDEVEMEPAEFVDVFVAENGEGDDDDGRISLDPTPADDIDGPDKRTGIFKTIEDELELDERTGIHRVAEDDLEERPEETTEVQQAVVQEMVAQVVSDTQRQMASRRAATQARQQQERVEADVRVERVLAEEVPIQGELNMAEAQNASDGRLADLRTKLRSLRAERTRYVVVGGN